MTLPFLPSCTWVSSATVPSLSALTRTTVGIPAARAGFAQLLATLPDLSGRVHRWSADDQAIYIDFSLSATLGRERFEWEAIDRFRLRDGLAIERVSYFDPLPLVAAVLRHPSVWPRLARLGIGQLRADA